MNAVDASDHYDVGSSTEAPSLCTIVVDTNPRAWAAMGGVLSISRAVANVLVFVNAHLAYSSANQVAILAAHSRSAVWLYPHSADDATAAAAQAGGGGGVQDGDGDVTMRDNNNNGGGGKPASANKFPQFANIEASLLSALRALIGGTTEADLAGTTTTQLAGALTLALARINKVGLQFATSKAAADPLSSSGGPGSKGGGGATSSSGGNAAGGGPNSGGDGGQGGGASLHARILVLSVSDSEPAQYIPTMNAVFAAAHGGVAIDVLALRGQPTFLQQASFLTRGTYIAAAFPRPGGGGVGGGGGGGGGKSTAALEAAQQQAGDKGKHHGGSSGHGHKRHRSGELSGPVVEAEPPQQGILSYLMLGFLGACSSANYASTGGDASALGGGSSSKRGRPGVVASDDDASLLLSSSGGGASFSASPLVPPAPDAVDFRAACFCHRRVVDSGFVCSVCLSIFCGVPPHNECLTCGSRLALGDYGSKPAVVPRRRKKKRGPGGLATGTASARLMSAAAVNGADSREDSAAGTPRP